VTPRPGLIVCLLRGDTTAFVENIASCELESRLSSIKHHHQEVLVDSAFSLSETAQRTLHSAVRKRPTIEVAVHGRSRVQQVGDMEFNFAGDNVFNLKGETLLDERAGLET
jgi:hypothetical protein